MNPSLSSRKKTLSEKLKRYGASDRECDFLVQPGEQGEAYTGQRVELNSMTAPQFVAWLEGKLVEVGVTKLVPDRQTLQTAYQAGQGYPTGAGVLLNNAGK